MKNKVLIFDFDGTIADTFQQTLKIANLLAVEFDFQPIKENEVKELKNKSVKDVIRFLKIHPLKVPQIAARAKAELNKNILLIKPVDGLKEMIANLKQLGYRVGIVSSNSAENILIFLTRNEMNLFDFIHTSSRIWSKNHGINQLIKNHGLSTNQILYIGDETRDIDAARKAGIMVAAVTWGYNSAQALQAHRPDYIVNSPQEFLELCLRGIL